MCSTGLAAILAAVERTKDQSHHYDKSIYRRCRLRDCTYTGLGLLRSIALDYGWKRNLPALKCTSLAACIQAPLTPQSPELALEMRCFGLAWIKRIKRIKVQVGIVAIFSQASRQRADLCLSVQCSERSRFSV